MARREYHLEEEAEDNNNRMMNIGNGNPMMDVEVEAVVGVASENEILFCNTSSRPDDEVGNHKEDGIEIENVEV